MTRNTRRQLTAGALIAALLFAGCGGDEDPRATATEAAPAATTVPEPATTSTSTTSTRAAPAPLVDLCAFRDLGTWVDVYDSVPAFAERGRVTPVTPDDITTMHQNGVHTLYLQVAKDDERSPGVITDPASAGEFLRAAHAVGIRVVAWYLATHRDEALDRERALALVHFGVDGERFDGVALDIEGTEAVGDVAERNRRLVELVAALDGAAGTMPIGAIVYPPVAFDVLNPALWPDFPWREIAPHVDVWLPMAYWTYRDGDSPYRDAYRYTSENVERLRAHLGDPSAPVHVIGGIGDKATGADYDAFRRAAADSSALGYSIYDFDTLDPSAWPLLRTPSTC